MITPSAGLAAEVPRIPSLKRLVKVGLTLVFLSAVASVLNGRSQAQGGISIIWLSNGFMIGVLLCASRRQWPALLGLATLVDFGVNLGLHTPPSYSAYLTFCNMAEIAIASSLMYASIAPNPDLSEMKQVRSFLLFGVGLAPLVASLLAMFGLREWLGVTFWHGLQFWFAADVLGIATITPLYLSYHHRRRFSVRSKFETTSLILLVVVVSFLVFGVSTIPTLWVVLLFLILLGARVGFNGSALGLLIVLLIGGYYTVNGHGPIPAGMHGSASQRILLFQVFTGSAMLALYLTEVAMAASNRMRLGLEASETRFRLLAEASRDIIVLAGLDGERKYVSPAATEILGWEQNELLGRDYRQITHPDDLKKMAQLLRDCRDGRETGSLSYRCRKKDGQYVWMESNIRLYQDGNTGDPAGFVYILRDISERKLAEDKLQDAFRTVEQLALVDGLTGVANRRLLDDTLSREWLRAIRDGLSISLLLIDVDHFKKYNDIYGHLAGDLCLRTVASAIQTTLRRPSDLLARYGGEEFVIVLPNTPSAGAEILSSKIMEAVERCAIPHAGSQYGFVTISLGCATTTATMDSTPIELLKMADDAMYHAKTSGRNRMQVAGGELVAR